MGIGTVKTVPYSIIYYALPTRKYFVGQGALTLPWRSLAYRCKHRKRFVGDDARHRPAGWDRR